MDVNKSGRLLAGRIAPPRWKGNTDPRSTSGELFTRLAARRRPTQKRCRVKDDNRRDSLTSSGGWGKGWKGNQPPPKGRKEADRYRYCKRNGKIVRRRGRKKLCCKKKAVTGNRVQYRESKILKRGEEKKKKEQERNKRKLWATEL